MSKLTFILVATTIACAAAAVHLWQSLADQREQNAALQTQLSQLEEALANSNTAAASIPAPPISEDSSLADDPPVQQPAVFNAPPPQVAMSRGGAPDPQVLRRMRQSHEQQLRLLKDPEYRELMRSQQRAGMQQVYADLQPLLGLSDGESEQLLDLLAEHSLRNMEYARPPFGPDDSGLDRAALREQQRIMQEQRQRNEDEIAALLGPRYRDWQEYQQNGWSRGQVTRLRHTLALSTDPLRPEQIKPLVDAIAREQRQLGSPAAMPGMTNGRPTPEMQARWVEDMVERTRQSHERIRVAVSGLLSPSQYDQLLRQQNQELKMQELNARQQRARADAIARGEPPADVASGFSAISQP